MSKSGLSISCLLDLYNARPGEELGVMERYYYCGESGRQDDGSSDAGFMAGSAMPAKFRARFSPGLNGSGIGRPQWDVRGGGGPRVRAIRPAPQNFGVRANPFGGVRAIGLAGAAVFAGLTAYAYFTREEPVEGRYYRKDFDGTYSPRLVSKEVMERTERYLARQGVDTGHYRNKWEEDVVLGGGKLDEVLQDVAIVADALTQENGEDVFRVFEIAHLRHAGFPEAQTLLRRWVSMFDAELGGRIGDEVVYEDVPFVIGDSIPNRDSNVELERLFWDRERLARWLVENEGWDAVEAAKYAGIERVAGQIAVRLSGSSINKVRAVSGGSAARRHALRAWTGTGDDDLDRAEKLFGTALSAIQHQRANEADAAFAQAIDLLGGSAAAKAQVWEMVAMRYKKRGLFSNARAALKKAEELFKEADKPGDVVRVHRKNLRISNLIGDIYGIAQAQIALGEYKFSRARAEMAKGVYRFRTNRSDGSDLIVAAVDMLATAFKDIPQEDVTARAYNLLMQADGLKKALRLNDAERLCVYAHSLLREAKEDGETRILLLNAHVLWATIRIDRANMEAVAQGSVLDPNGKPVNAKYEYLEAIELLRAELDEFSIEPSPWEREGDRLQSEGKRREAVKAYRRAAEGNVERLRDVAFEPAFSHLPTPSSPSQDVGVKEVSPSEPAYKN